MRVQVAGGFAPFEITNAERLRALFTDRANRSLDNVASLLDTYDYGAPNSESAFDHLALIQAKFKQTMSIMRIANYLNVQQMDGGGNPHRSHAHANNHDADARASIASAAIVTPAQANSAAFEF